MISEKIIMILNFSEDGAKFQVGLKKYYQDITVRNIIVCYILIGKPLLRLCENNVVKITLLALRSLCQYSISLNASLCNLSVSIFTRIPYGLA